MASLIAASMPARCANSKRLVVGENESEILKMLETLPKNQ
jgi:hypothetical protein